MSCIQNFCNCSATVTKPPYCCSGFCLQLEGESSGYCTIRNWTAGPSDNIVCPTDQRPSTSGNDSLKIFLPIALVVVIAFIAAFGWLYYRTKKLEKVLTKREQKLFFSGDLEAVNSNGYAHETTDNLPYNKELEISEGGYEIDWEKPLGQGTYGIVLKGKLENNEVVAIKTVRNLDTAAGAQQLRALLSEIKVLQYIGKVENVVGIIGCNTSKLWEGKALLFLEYCPLGSLEKYLRFHKHSFQEEQKQAMTTRYVNIQDSNGDVITPPPEVCEISHNDLILWSTQIAKAMAFLVIKKVIHADLATRNVLLLRKDCVKITDFGLSRKLYDYGNYVKQNQEPLPWRWMALESLQQLSFSHKSDVWSLGITLWEIYSLGDVPYPGLSWTPNFIQCLEDGLRPTKPFAASQELYNIMLDCWQPIPENRPTFKSVYNQLQRHHSK